MWVKLQFLCDILGEIGNLLHHGQSNSLPGGEDVLYIMSGHLHSIILVYGIKIILPVKALSSLYSDAIIMGEV